jgi:hypothetical protein
MMAQKRLLAERLVEEGCMRGGIAANHYLPLPPLTDSLHSIVSQPFVSVLQEAARLEAS